MAHKSERVGTHRRRVCRRLCVRSLPVDCVEKRQSGLRIGKAGHHAHIGHHARIGRLARREVRHQRDVHRHA